MSLAPLTFTGVSTYSNDFQTILNRSVQIAQIPVTALQNKDSDALQQKTLLASLQSVVGDLSSSLGALGTTATNRALAATSSDPTSVTVISTGATSAGNYTIDSITSAASAASERTPTGYADSTSTPVSSTGQLQLTVGTKNYPITLANNSLVGLRDQINSSGAGVTASILTTGTGNYLTVSANATGATTLKLTDDPGGANTGLLTNTNQGSNAVFSLNGIPVSQSGNVVNSVVPGITFTIQKASSTPVALSLSSDSSQLASTLQDFVSKFNAVRQQLNAQVGPAAGLLSGDTVVQQLQSVLRGVTSYWSSTGSVHSLSDLGVEFDSSGQASFNTTRFSALSDTQIGDAFSFIGSATSGLGAFSGTLSQFSDPIGGLIKTEENGLDQTDKSLQNQINTLTDRMTRMQQSLNQQLQQADAFAALLESQQQQLSASLQGLNLVLYGKNPNQTS